jgi:hypothetical protein
MDELKYAELDILVISLIYAQRPGLNVNYCNETFSVGRCKVQSKAATIYEQNAGLSSVPG